MIVEKEIANLNPGFIAQEKELNYGWIKSPEWEVLKAKKLAEARTQKDAEHAGVAKKIISQTCKSKTFQTQQILEQ